MNKKWLSMFSLVVLLLVLPAMVLAQTVTPSPQNSHVLIQNLSSTDASVVVEVYDATTGSMEATDSFTIPGDGATTVHSTAGTNVPGHRYLDLPTFRGSMVVMADQPVVAVNVNVGGTPPNSHSAYESINPSYADTTVFVPSIHWRDAQWSTVGIQNTGSVQATATYTYFLQNGTVIDTGTATIEPGRSNMRDVATDIDIGTVPEGVGAMQISADQPLAVSIMETLQTRTEAYIGFPTWYGDTTIYMPSVHHNPNGQWSHMLVQNMGDATANVELSYYSQDGTLVNYYTSTIAMDGSITYHTNGNPSEDGVIYEPTNMGNVGTAVIESDQPLVSVNVETIGIGAANIQPYAYNGFRSDAGGTELLFPSVHANPGGQWSHILIQNLSSTSANDVTLEYYTQDGSLDSSYTLTLQPSGSITFHTNGNPSEDGVVYAPSGSFGNVGSAVVTSSSGLPLVGVNVETLRGYANVYAGAVP